MSIIKRNTGLSAVILATLLLGGCVATEGAKANLTIANPSSTLPTTDDVASFAADLPDLGPDPEARPAILSLASGASTMPDAASPKVAPDNLQAMVEPEQSNIQPKNTVKASAVAEPVVASNSERNCLMRVMYFVSNRSSPDGLLAVGTVVMHRLQNGTWGNSVCSVVQARNQFAPGLMSRKLQGNLADLEALADSILAGKRHPQLAKNVMFFHVAGMKFPYKNMHYVLVAGGNTFYYKAPRKRRA